MTDADADAIQAFAKEQMCHVSGLLSLLMPRTAGVGICVKEADGAYRLANRAMEAIFGYPQQMWVGKTDAELFPPEVAAQLQGSDREIAGGAAASSDELNFQLDRVPVSCLWLKFPMLGADGRVTSIASMIFDTRHQEAVAEMRNSLGRLQRINEDLQKSLIELDRLARTDKLTGAWNRRRLEETVIDEMDRLKRYDHPLSMLTIDIDFFKRINDEHGHAAGDRVLTEIAAMFQETLRASDSLTRWGGEEFVVLCPNTTLSTAALLGERLRAKVAASGGSGGDSLTVSVGVAECLTEESWEQWFHRADAALYRAKAAGRNQVQLAAETPRRQHIGESVAAHFVQLSWHAAYQSGHALIDRQHQDLFDAANNLLAAMLSSRPADEVADLIEVLLRDLVGHFADEEGVIAAAGFPGAAAHAAIHRDLIEHARALLGGFRAGNLAIGELFQFFAHDVVARHMLGADREFFPYLQDRRGGDAAAES